MTVKQVICRAMRLVGRDDAADAIENTDDTELSDEYSRLCRAFLTYLNSVCDELSRRYFPLTAEEELSFSDGTAPLSSLTYSPVKIRTVTVDKKPIAWHISGGYLYADAEKAEVVYEYVPAEFSASDDFENPFTCIGESVLEYGMAAEHFLVIGEAQASLVWENKYREIAEAAAARTERGGFIKKRWWL